MPPSPDAPHHEGRHAIAAQAEPPADMRSPAATVSALSQAEPFAPPSAAAWLNLLKRHSRLPMAILEPQTLQLQFANQCFCQTVGIAESAIVASGDSGIGLLDMLLPDEQTRVQQILQHHLLQAILAYLYPQRSLLPARLLEEPVILSCRQTQSELLCKVELRLSSECLKVQALSPDLEQPLRQCLGRQPTLEHVMAQLYETESPLWICLQQLQHHPYRVTGFLLLEGTEVTERETINTLVQLLIGRESVLQPHKFSRANELMRGLFRAADSLIMSAENEQAKLFTDLDQSKWQVHSYSVESLQTSLFLKAAERGTVLNIPDLSAVTLTPCEQSIADRGARSLLIIPLVTKSIHSGSMARRLLGLVGMASDRAYAFDNRDVHNATTLVPALTAAMRYTTQDRFTNIHSSVRWRFEEEAERRSWGLPPEPIAFTDVYPLYGISDIRGSSSERNRAIQSDLLAQFELALSIIEAVCSTKPYAFAQQFRLDLLSHVEKIKQGITVDAEVTFIRYLSENLEPNFDYFARCSPAAAAAVAAYRDACDNEQQCVYTARSIYDKTIQRINNLLRDTWTRWQENMQAITRHYCDVEATDGIDHMLYVGKSIDPGFSPFQLRSLRYEQLRAVCDCGRVAFHLKETCDTHLEVTHLVLVQDSTVDISHDEATERLFEVRGSRDTRYEIVKKRIDKAVDTQGRQRITQPGMLTIVYSTADEWNEYRQYLHYLHREGWVEDTIEQGLVEPLQGVNGLKFARVRILPPSDE
ncbi:GAF domain-containing protein [Almyronema epifaneia]|uniref:GAF domain-containing protein n=1 Tax=Almyronema epifaneia S1 TaxID=2991925 RepID=A0ABW6IIR7_9CYAN